MQDLAVYTTSIAAASGLFLAQVDAGSLTSTIKEAGSLAILAFVVYYTFTRIAKGLEELKPTLNP